MKKAASDLGNFEDATGTWFIAGLDADRLAQLDSVDSADDTAQPACPSGWAAMMMRLHQLLRRN